MWPCVASLFILTSCLYYYVTRTFSYWTSRNVPGPKPVALFGNIKESALRRKPIALVLRNVYNDYPNEKLVGIYRMTDPCLLIRDLDIIKQVLIKDFHVFDSRGVVFSREGYGANLFHSDGDTWRPLRHVLAPIFTTRKLKGMVYLLAQVGDRFVESVDGICRQRPEQSVGKLFARFGLAAICSCAFGIDVEQHGDKLDALYAISEKATKVNYFSELDMMFPGILKYVSSTIFPAYAVNTFDGLIKKVIAQRGGKASGRSDLMDLMLELKQTCQIKRARMCAGDRRRPLELTDSVIAAQAFVFFLGGHETSSTTMTYVLYQLAFNPDIQDKLIAEVDGVLDRYDGDVTFEALSEMNYAEKVLNETLRMYPIGDKVLRAAKQDYRIPNTDVVVTKGQTLYVSQSGIHWDGRYYPEPHKFDPERFSPELVRARHPCAYMPFGMGPRNCIGSRFAKLQLRVGMLKFFSKFRVEVAASTRRVLNFDPTRFVLTPDGSVTLKIIPRTD